MSPGSPFYGDLDVAGTSDPRQSYTSAFARTSAALPIVVGAAALIQERARKVLNRPLLPAEMRRLLVSTGLAQGSNWGDEGSKDPSGLSRTSSGHSQRWTQMGNSDGGQ